MRKSVSILISMFLLASLALCKTGVDISELYNINTLQCFVRNGAQFAVVQAFTKEGYLDRSVVQTLK